MNPSRVFAVEIDTLIASLHAAKKFHTQRATWAAQTLHLDAGHNRVGVDISGNPLWNHALSIAIADVSGLVATNPRLRNHLDAYTQQQALLIQIQVEQDEANAVYAEYRWNRAFLVTNINGHVHKHMTCSTCFPTTEYEWLTHYSGATEDEIVKAAGELACSVCYPLAPSAYLNRPADLVSNTRQEEHAATVERKAVKAEREAKRAARAPTAAGNPLVVPQDEWGHVNATLNTEVTARKTWNGIEDIKSQNWGRPVTQRQMDAQTTIVHALAEKHGRTHVEQEAELKSRYGKRKR